jgi:REP element-mobilizing transposase RayT
MPVWIIPGPANILLQFHFPFTDLDAFVVMPDHIHGIIAIKRSIEISIVGALHATPLQLLSEYNCLAR